MSYHVAVPRSVSTKVLSWRLPKATTVRLLERLRDMLRETPPEDLGRRVAAPVPCVVVRVGFDDPATGQWLEFVAWVDDRRYRNTRIIIDVAARGDL